MDVKKSSRWQVFRRAYFAPPTAQPRWKRDPYSVGKWFDVAVVVAFAASFVGSLVS